MDRQPLDYIGLLEGTDKTSLANDYLRHYERVLDRYRDTPVELLEIGVAEGASLRTWNRFFPLGTITGVDNNPAARPHAGGRVAVEIGSQADPEFLSALAARHRPDVIIDDGSHQSAHVFLTFEHLFPCLRPGGIYIIEDVYLHHGVYVANYHAGGGVTPTEHFAAMAVRLASGHIESACTEADRSVLLAIDRIEFIPRAIIVHKRDADDLRKRLDYLFQAAQQADQSLTWFHLSMVLMNHDDLERAEHAAQRALTLAPDRVAHWPRLADAQARRGKLAEAIETLREGIRRDPGNASLQSTLTGLEARLAATG
jgi:tetratricopeptide (TPR) repeat protein